MPHANASPATRGAHERPRPAGWRAEGRKVSPSPSRILRASITSSRPPGLFTIDPRSTAVARGVGELLARPAVLPRGGLSPPRWGAPEGSQTVGRPSQRPAGHANMRS
jgi:hypothetical protein